MLDTLLLSLATLDSAELEQMRRGVVALVSDQHHKVTQAALEALIRWCNASTELNDTAAPVVDLLLPKAAIRWVGGYVDRCVGS